MRRLWSWWVARCERPVDIRPLALVRIGAAMVIILDLLRVAQLGLVNDLFRPYAAGGLSQVQDSAYIVGRWLSPELGGPVLFGLSLLCLALVALGLAARPAMFIGVLAYAQLGHLYPPGDRAIDRLLRTVLLILVFSDSHRRYSVAGGPRLDQTRGWTEDLIKSVLVIVYMSAGISKVLQQPGWLSWSGMPVLYRVMTDPLAAHVDPDWGMNHWGLLRFLGWGTVLMESSAPLLFTRFAPYWAVAGVGMHLGIALTMDLGMFSYGMLAMYPLLLWPWISRWLARRAAR